MKTPRFWQSCNLVSIALTPVSWLYRLGAWLDRRLTKPQHARIPVIAIGNVTAGGAGKTPTTIALAPILTALGYTPHILTRGYQAQSNLTAHRVTDADGWQHVGDEPLLLHHAAPTWVGRDRIASAHAASAAGATIALCDDALQHHRLYKNLSLLVIDGPYGIGNGKLLPAGPLRESFGAAIARSDAIILIGEDAQQLTAPLSIPVFRAQLKPSAETGFLTQTPWLAFAGIGRPEKFFATLRENGATLVATHSFPDHHAYSETDITALLAEASQRGARLITTEKDWVKLPPTIQSHIAILPVRLIFEDDQRLREFLRTHLSIHKLS